MALIYYLFPLILHKYRGGCGVEKRNSKYTIWVLKTVFEKEQFPYNMRLWLALSDICKNKEYKYDPTVFEDKAYEMKCICVLSDDVMLEERFS